MVKKTILVVDDNMVNRSIIQRMLQNEYDVLEAENGIIAMQIIRKKKNIISAVLLDLIMPEMDGYQVIEQMKKDSMLSLIPILVMTGESGIQNEIRVFELGANDFISKPYEIEIVRNRLKNTILLRETASLANEAIKDRLTGLLNRETFYDKIKELIYAHEQGYYVLSYVNVEKFRIINEQYGLQRGDEIIKKIGKVLSTITDIGGLVARLSADNFAVLYAKSKENSDVLKKVRKDIYTAGDDISLVFSVGRYVVDDYSLTPNMMLDRARMAEEVVKGNSANHIFYYNDELSEKIFREQEIVSDMKKALANHQFEIWIQPQYNHVSKTLYGGEALVRWRHPEKGLIPPNEFIPVFEKNGFVYQLDKFVWEETFKLIHKWIDSGMETVPISMNVPRIDITQPDFFDIITDLIRKYDIPIEYVRLEITESAFASSSIEVIKIVKDLREFGITIEIDDFGSGYSSLNALKDVFANVLKLDMHFLDKTEDMQRSGSILSSIVRMANWLDMGVIAEGVETNEEADFFKTIGCFYIQGYLYSKPLAVPEFENLLVQNKIDEGKDIFESIKTDEYLSLWNPESIETLIFNNYSAASCIIEYHNESIEVVKLNDRFAKEVSNHQMTIEQVMKMDLMDYLDDKNKKIFLDELIKTCQTREENTFELVFKNLIKKTSLLYLHVVSKFYAKSGERLLFYILVTNITALREAERDKKILSNQLDAIAEACHSGVSIYDIKDDELVLLSSNNEFFRIIGYTKEEYHNEITNPLHIVVEDDRNIVINEIKNISSGLKPTTCRFRIKKRDGNVIWVQHNTSLIHVDNESGENKTIQMGLLIDITDQMQGNTEKREYFEENHAFDVRSDKDAVCLIVLGNNEIPSVCFANQKFYDLHGYTKAKFDMEVGSLYDFIIPDDVDRVKQLMKQMRETRKTEKYEYHINKKNNGIIKIQCTAFFTTLEGVNDDVLVARLIEIKD